MNKNEVTVELLEIAARAVFDVTEARLYRMRTVNERKMWAEARFDVIHALSTLRRNVEERGDILLLE